MGDPGATAVFDALTCMLRNFVRLASDQNPSDQIAAKLDDCLSRGWMLKSEFAIGGAGALALTLVAVSPLGTIIEIVNMDAPPSAQPFRLAESESRF